jgi:hypothetical protein
MATFFRILFGDGSEGFQINSDRGGYITDLDGRPRTGKLEYKTIDAKADAPAWFVEAPIEPPVEELKDRRITPYALSQRMTLDERAGIETLAVDSLQVRAWLRYLAMALSVDLDSSALREDLARLKLADNRIEEIAAAPITEDERPR